MVLVDSVNWRRFFLDQQNELTEVFSGELTPLPSTLTHILALRYPLSSTRTTLTALLYPHYSTRTTLPREVASESEHLDEMFTTSMQRLAQERSLFLRNDEAANFSESVRSLIPPHALVVHPLPFGRVLQSQLVGPGEYVYYQIRSPDATILTIEATLVKGDMDMYVAEGSGERDGAEGDVFLPTADRHTHRCITSKLHSNGAIRIVIPGREATLIGINRIHIYITFRTPFTQQSAYHWKNSVDVFFRSTSMTLF